ncbi:MAG: ATP-dependent zinc metalloprotease FtsH, partial [Eubacteriales bacterium]|nr:ATP-dependent zinc metalloprotease FtsH [Eubacteriales bacterium]
MKPNRNRARDLGFYVLLLVIMVAVIFTMTRDTEPDQIESYSELVDLFKQEKVQSFVYRPGSSSNRVILEIRTDDPTMPTKQMSYDLYSFSVFYEDFNEIIEQQYADGIIESYDYETGVVIPWWASILPYVLLMGGALVLWYVMMNRMGGGGAGGVARFSKARTRSGSDEKNKKTFNDVAGC